MLRPIERAGYVFDVDPEDLQGDWDFWTEFEHQRWEPEVDDILDQYLSPGSVFADIGAWIGPITLLAAGRGATVHAVEPDPAAQVLLRRNVAALPASLRKEVQVHSLAIADHDGLVQIGHREDRTFGDSMTSTIFTRDAIHVPCLTLETFLSSNGPFDLIKMDIEGGEETAIGQGARYLQQIGIPLLLSVHAPLTTNPDRYVTNMINALAGFHLTWLSGGNWAGLGTMLAVPCWPLPDGGQIL